ncbi:hypothetical protein P3T76_002543 [Phytophthora citrophthora]|uniref:Uncharacterized protein n=1 Tax=Phytophthora citrophthora TaxID=4793 RepID=A0AAD9GVU5_9STRA|nr:hypothetical protein P3T76_002543 [Phytophthora citrophthora]
MDSPLAQSWTSPSSNQKNGYSIDHDTPFEARKQVDSSAGAVGISSPELESSCNLDDSNCEQEESENDTQIDHEDETHDALKQRCRQLQADIHVLASHMENQERVLEQERREAKEERLALQKRNSALERELNGLRVERDALFKQSARLATQRTEDDQQASEMRETQDELLRALEQQQQKTELLQTAVTCSSQDRVEARKALDKAQMHCRRLEEELSSAHTHVLHLQNERDTLKAALDSTVTGAAGFEARQLQTQDEVIASLRADLVQMEFELKTLSVDKSTLEEQVEKLQLRLSSDNNGDYEIVPLGNNTTSDRMTKRKGQKKRTTIRPVRSTKEETSRRGSDLFNNLLELPNAVSEPQECANATIWLSPAASYFSSSNNGENDAEHGRRRSFRERIAPPSGLASFMTKTVQSARKHIATPLQNTFGSPHH